MLPNLQATAGRWALRVLCSLAVIGLVGALAWQHGYQAAATSAEARATAEALARTRAALAGAQQALQARAAAAEHDAATLARLGLRVARISATEAQLTERLAHVQLLAAAADAAPCAAAPGADGAADPALSDAAVRLWNGALFAASGASAPAAVHPCTAADAALGACAPGPAVTLSQAWANHITNAAACAAQREQLSELIATVRQREAAQAEAAGPTPTQSKGLEP